MKYFYKINADKTASIGSGTVIPQGFTEYTIGSEPKILLDTLNAEKFKNSKDAKTNEINTACATQITSGFTSLALGTIRTYQSQELDQLNLIGVVTGGTDDYFKCAKTVNGKLVWSYEMHTAVQLKQVLNDGKAHKQALLQKAGTLKAKVDLAKTQVDLDLIV